MPEAKEGHTESVPLLTKFNRGSKARRTNAAEFELAEENRREKARRPVGLVRLDAVGIATNMLELEAA